MPVSNIKNADDYKNIVSKNLVVVLFSADWAEQCKQVQDVLEDLSKILAPKISFASLTAEEFPEIAQEVKIEAVPTVIFFDNGKAIDRVDGVDVASITAKCQKLAANASSDEPLEDRLKALINKAPLMIFMKGTRDAPRCGFSKQLISITNETGLPYETFDILTDEDVRQGLKTYSDWPTYPQVYVKGELVGGLDIIKELLASNELLSTLKG